jgi:catechol 2,3-dioxygenase-like lactoylglutathione lyase family enzyme
MKAEFQCGASLKVYDRPTAVRFYRDLLGFDFVNQSRDSEAFLVGQSEAPAPKVRAATC